MLNLLLNLKCVQGILYIHLCLEKIKITKELFLAEIEDEIESFIPSALSQDSLPMSFRYYDHILAMVAENIS